MIITILEYYKEYQRKSKIERKTFSQTDQKKQPCLAAKACQLRDKKISSVLENPYKIEFVLIVLVGSWGIAL